MSEEGDEEWSVFLPSEILDNFKKKCVCWEKRIIFYFGGGSVVEPD